MTDTVLHYKGKPITNLSRDELVDALTWAVQEIEYQRERANRYLGIADTDLRHGVMALQRLAPRPISVSERLPRPELCWWFEADEDCGYGSNWTLLRIRGSATGYTHWLPAHALPVPSHD